VTATGKVARAAWIAKAIVVIVAQFALLGLYLVLFLGILFGAMYGIAVGYHAAFGYPRGHVTRARLGAAWPLTVGEAVLHCRNGDVLTLTLLFKDDDAEVSSFELVSDPRPDDPIHEIWDERKPLRPLLVRARALCANGA
jgi:hypothetical protein